MQPSFLSSVGMVALAVLARPRSGACNTAYRLHQHPFERCRAAAKPGLELCVPLPLIQASIIAIASPPERPKIDLSLEAPSLSFTRSTLLPKTSDYVSGVFS